MRLFAALISLALLAVAPAIPAGAEDAPPPVKGLFLLTDYPAITVRPGTTTTINLKLRNYALDPDRYTLSVSGVPQGWTATLLGGGQPVAAAMVATNDSTSLQLRLDVPENAAIGTTANLTVTAKGASVEKTLPLAVSLAKDLPAKLTIKAQLAVAARHREVELRIPDGRQERQRPQSRRQPRRPGAEEFRDELHRAVRQPGIVLDADRRRPVQDREAQGAAAEHHRRQPLSGVGQGLGRGRLRRHQRRAGDHRPAAAQPRRPRRRAVRPRRGRQAGRRSRSSSPTTAARRPTRSRCPAARRAAGRSSSIRRRSTRSRPPRTRKCRPASPRRRRRSPATTRRPSPPPRAATPPRRSSASRSRPRRCGASSAPASSLSRC